MELMQLALKESSQKEPLVIAGPCSAETEEQVIETARRLADSGIHIYRAGIWKPRTHPGGFEGVGEKGLVWLAKAREITGMKVATEVATKTHAEAAIGHGIDILWIGARTTANPFAVQEIADYLGTHCPDIPVLVKNPVSPDLELWIGALQRLSNSGVQRLCAVHRGFSSYAPGIYRNKPYWRIPLELHRRIPELLILCDPSHITGRSDMIASMSQKALNIGFDGLMIESHCHPEAAWSDSQQQITPERLREIISHLEMREVRGDQQESLKDLRMQIDEIDARIVEALASRMDISRKIGEYKRNHKMPVVQSARYSDIISDRLAAARNAGVSPEFMRQILALVHEESVRVQAELSADIKETAEDESPQ